MTSTNIVWIGGWLSNSVPLDHKACIAGGETTEIPDPDNEWSVQTYEIINLHATGAQHFSAPHVNL